MELKKLVRNNDGTVEATWVLDQEQQATLLWFAVNELIAKGLATVVNISPEEFEKLKQEAEGNEYKAVLEAADVNDLPKA